MARFLGLVKVSAEEASRMVQEGPRSRREFIELLVSEVGGTVEGLWLTNVGDWDLVCIVDMQRSTSAAGAAATLARRAARLTDRERWIELADVDLVAEALEQMSGSATTSN
jgi:uncharacterized protein with GYD domain